MGENSFFNKYKFVALLIFNTLLLFVLLNILLFYFFKIRDTHYKPNPVINKYGMERIKKIYPNRIEADIKKLLDESWSRPMAYDSYTGFKESEWQGTYVNVAKDGYRLINKQGPWPPNPTNDNIFIFGGSTMFGYGVADDETTASYLQKILRDAGWKNATIYNFGQGRYFLGQERVLFEKLLLQGNLPKLAIFVDGLNEYHADGEPYLGSTAQAIFSGNILPLIYPQLPVGRLFTSLQQRLQARFAVNKQTNSATSSQNYYNDQQTINKILNNYIGNKKLAEGAGKVFNVKTLFVWQPVPLYKYNLQYHLFGAEASGENDTQQFSKYTYPQMAELVKNKQLGNNFLWAADLQENINEPLYVDAVHYAPALANSLAQAIANNLLANKFLYNIKF